MCKKPDTDFAKQKASISYASTKKSVALPPTHSAAKRDTSYDLLLFFLPALLWRITPVYPIYIIGLARILATRIVNSLHYIFFDKDNYVNKLAQKQLERERDDYLVGIVLHMCAQAMLQVVFPTMFFAPESTIKSSAVYTLWSHIFIVEPLYYLVHRWLHTPCHMKAMHGFHHLSISTLPSTSLVQNFSEHFVYIATFGPAFLVPFLFTWRNHWTVIGAYLVLFDLCNAYGHTNIRTRHWIWNHPMSPMRYLFYTPEFHLGHHAYFNANYGLFMPMWDHLFGTYRDYRKVDAAGRIPSRQQDFVFIGHNAGIGHLLTCPEVSPYNVYDSFKRTWLPIQLEFLIMHVIICLSRLMIRSYSVSRYIVENKYVGRIVCILRSPWDYMSPTSYDAINQDIVKLIRTQYDQNGTRYFGLGNLNKMKQLNDGGNEIVKLIQSDSYLKDKEICVWTGDSLTTASVYHQIAEIPAISGIFFIGANGKIGQAVIEMLLSSRADFKICIYSKYQAIRHPNVTYTSNLDDMFNYEVVVTGKILPSKHWERTMKRIPDKSKSRVILDYTVPFIPIALKAQHNIRHIQIGILETSGNALLKGHFDVCMGHDQHHIYPCHAGCILNMVEGRETHETGSINRSDVDRLWKKALSYGLRNKSLSIWS
jgi:sterol desaturase/sphingolipid hydroxylase (fatty acid hydroxylase superfamily)